MYRTIQTLDRVPKSRACMAKKKGGGGGKKSKRTPKQYAWEIIDHEKIALEV